MRVALLVLAACGAPTRGTVASPQSLVVLERGAEPHRLLRYELTVGTKQRVELTSKSVVAAALTNTTLDVINQRSEFPTVHTRFTLGVAEHGDGRARVTRVLDDVVLDADGDPRIASKLRDDAAKQRKITTAWWLTPTGEVLEASGDRTSSRVAVEDLLKLAVQYDIVRLPNEPVGIGAAWKISSHPRLQGVMWDRVQTIRVRNLTGAEVEVETETVMTAAAQDLVVQPNMTTRLTGATLRMTTKEVLSLRGLATTSYGESSGEINHTVRNRHLKITSSTTIKTVFTTKPAP